MRVNKYITNIVIANANSCLLRLDSRQQQPLVSARRTTPSSSARSYIVLQRNKLSLVPVFTSGLLFSHRATSAATESGSLCRENKRGVGRSGRSARTSALRCASRLRTGCYRLAGNGRISESFPSSYQLVSVRFQFSVFPAKARLYASGVILR